MFKTISNDVVVIIGLEKMIISMEFGNIQLMRINVIINFCIDGRFKSRNK